LLAYFGRLFKVDRLTDFTFWAIFSNAKVISFEKNRVGLNPVTLFAANLGMLGFGG
jgi:hypothetical protein